MFPKHVGSVKNTDERTGREDVCWETINEKESSWNASFVSPDLKQCTFYVQDMMLAQYSLFYVAREGTKFCNWKELVRHKQMAKSTVLRNRMVH